jgi:hypothetical protein
MRPGSLEQELHAVALDNAFGRMTDEVYLRRKSELAAQIEGARRPEAAAHTVDPKRALGYLDDLRSLWDQRPLSPAVTCPGCAGAGRAQGPD